MKKLSINYFFKKHYKLFFNFLGVFLKFWQMLNFSSQTNFIVEVFCLLVLRSGADSPAWLLNESYASQVHSWVFSCLSSTSVTPTPETWSLPLTSSHELSESLPKKHYHTGSNLFFSLHIHKALLYNPTRLLWEMLSLKNPERDKNWVKLSDVLLSIIVIW